MNAAEHTTDNVTLLKSRTGHLVPKVIGEDGKRRILHSLSDPVKEGKLFADNIIVPPDSIVVILGLGLGYHVEQLLLQSPLHNTTVVIVEKEPLLIKILLHVSQSRWWDRDDIVLLTAEHHEQVITELSDVQLKNGFKPFVVVEHKPSVQLCPGFYHCIKNRLTAITRADCGGRLRYRKFTGRKHNILILHSKYYLLGEIVRSLKSMHHTVKVIMVDSSHNGAGKKEVIEEIIAEIMTFKPDFALTINHLGFDRQGILTRFFTDIELPYVSWYVDSPTFILEDFCNQLSPYLTIFVWDDSYVKELRTKGFENVFYLPLATDPYYFNIITNKRNHRHLACDVGFVGNSWSQVIGRCMDQMGEIEHLESVLEKAAAAFITSPDRCISNLTDTLSREEQLLFAWLTENMRDTLEATITWKATQMHRLSCVKKIIPFRPHIHGDPSWRRLLNGRSVVLPELNYYDELPHFYNLCTINLNTTSMQMKNAVNQRVFDVPACGSFLLTDYRPQLEELFDVGKEIVFYRHHDEIEDLAAFYLKHHTERNRIAARAHERVLGEHTYVHRLTALINHVEEIYG